MRNISHPSLETKSKTEKKVKCHLHFFFSLSDLHGVTTQKTGTLIVTAVIISDPTLSEQIVFFFFCICCTPYKPLLLIPSDRLRVSYHHAKSEELKLLTLFCVVPNWSHQKLLQQIDAVIFNEKSKDTLKQTVIKIKRETLVKKRFCKNEIESWISWLAVSLLGSRIAPCTTVS